MKFMVSILLGLNLLVQGTVLPASSCFIPNVTIPLSPAAQTDTAPAADLNISAPSAILMEASTGAVVYEKNFPRGKASGKCHQDHDAASDL